MKSRLLLSSSIILLCATITSAQVAYDYPSAIPAHGVYTYAQRSASVPLQPSAAPPYDFTSYSFGVGMPLAWAFVDAASTPYAADFPTATDCIYEVVEPSSDIEYTYAAVSSSVLRVLGFGDVDTTIALGDPMDLYLFPSYVATGYQDDYTIDGTNYQLINNPLSKGDLMTPYGNWQNVVMVERSTHEQGGPAEFTYLWFADDDLITELAVYDPNSQFLILNIPESFLPAAVHENQQPLLGVWPNPASEGTVQVRAAATNAAGSLSLTATDGRLVMDRSVTTDASGNVVLDVTGICAGAYELKLVTNAGEVQRSRLVITH